MTYHDWCTMFVISLFYVITGWVQGNHAVCLLKHAWLPLLFAPVILGGQWTHTHTLHHTTGSHPLHRPNCCLLMPVWCWAMTGIPGTAAHTQSLVRVGRWSAPAAILSSFNSLTWQRNCFQQLLSNLPAELSLYPSPLLGFCSVIISTAIRVYVCVGGGLAIQHVCSKQALQYFASVCVMTICSN